MDAQAAWRVIAEANRILLTTHVKPDGDGLGSMAALTEVLQAAGKQGRAVLLSPPPPKYGFVHGVGAFEQLGHGVTCEDLDGWADLLVVIDTCSWQQLRPLEPVVRSHAGRILAIDHHTTNDDLGQASFSDADAAATSPMVLELIEASGAEVTPTMAEALFVSLASDTGWFQFPSVTAEVLRLAARLQDMGAQPSAIYERLFQCESAAKMQLLARALPTVRIWPEGDVADFVISLEMFRECGAEPHDTENLINEAQRIEGVLVSILCIEQEPGVVKVSFRSKHDVDVARVAEGFGGGGHARAAGCTVEMPLEKARGAACNAVRQAMGRQ